MPWRQFYFFLSCSLAWAGPPDLGLDLELKKPCEGALVKEKSIDPDVKMLFEKYLFSEPVSTYVVESLIKDKFNIHHAATTFIVYHESDRRKAAEQILSHLRDWFIHYVNKAPMDKRVMLAEALGTSAEEILHMSGLFHESAESVTIKGSSAFFYRKMSDPYRSVEQTNIQQQFIDLLSEEFHLYMKYLNESKVLFIPKVSLGRKSYSGEWTRGHTYILGNGLVTVLSAFFEGDIFHHFPFYSLGIGSVITTVPWVAWPMISAGYEKTLGRFFGRQFLKKRFPQALPSFAEKLGDENLQQIPFKDPSDRLVKAILDEFLMLERVLEQVLEKGKSWDHTLPIATALNYGELLNILKKLLLELERTVNSSSPSERISLVGELADFLAMRYFLDEQWVTYLKLGVETSDKFKEKIESLNSSDPMDKGTKEKLELILSKLKQRIVFADGLKQDCLLILGRLHLKLQEILEDQP